MKIIILYIVSYVIFPIYGVAAHPGLAVAFVAGLGGSGPLVLVGVVILAIGFPVGIALVEHYRSHQRPNPLPAAEPPEPPIRVNTPTVDASQDVVSHSRGIPIPIADVPDNTHLLPPTGVAEGASPSTALPSDPFSKSIHSDVSSITSRDTESVLDPDRRRMDGTGTAGDEILPSSKPRMDDILRGTDSTCEQAKGPISSQISLPRPSILRSLSDEINIYFSMVAQSDSNGNEGARVSTRSSTKSSESSESSESNKSDSSNAEESPAGSGIFRPIASIKSFSEDEMTRNWAVRLKQDDELDRRIAEAASPLSAEPDPINPRLEPILRRVTQLGLDSESTQVLA